jgi:hypothetical protein
MYDLVDKIRFRMVSGLELRRSTSENSSYPDMMILDSWGVAVFWVIERS